MNNEYLAKVWQNNISQIVFVWPLVWKHEPDGNWFIARVTG